LIHMGFFDTVLASLNDPRRATQESDLQSLLSAFGGSRGASSANADQIAGLIGGFLKPMLREQQMTSGPQGVDSLLHSLRQNADSPDRLRDVLGAERMDQMVDRAQQRTGLDANSILRLLSVALPAVIALLQSGRPAATPTGTVASAPRGTTPAGTTNPILSQFLDSDGDGDVDMADMLRLTSRFLQK
jgi:uncharacterized protein YidB (DUF937 family)